jgi:hypothetical protein
MKKTLIALMVFLSFASYAQKGSYRVWVDNGRVFIKENLSYKSLSDYPKELFYKSIFSYDSTKIVIGFNGSNAYAVTPNQFLDSAGVAYGTTVLLAINSFNQINNAQYSVANTANRSSSSGSSSISYVSSAQQSSLNQDDVSIPQNFYSGFIQWVNAGTGSVVIQTSGGGSIILNSGASSITYNPNLGIKYSGISIIKSSDAKIQWSFAK